MKNLIKPFGIALIASSLFFTACEKDPEPEVTPNPATFTLDALNPTEQSSSLTTDEVNVKSNLTVTSEGTASLKWVRAGATLPTGWIANICDNVTCHDEATMNYTISVEPNTPTELKIAFMTGGATGTGVLELLVFDPIDSVNTVQMITYTGTLR